MNPQRIFYFVLGNNLIATVTNMFVWFAATFWVFLETQSVLATSYIAGIFALSNMLSAFLFGSIVDRTRKKTAMLYSSVISFVFYAIAAVMFIRADEAAFSEPTSVVLWAFIIALVVGSVAGNLRTIALSTLVTLLFETGRDKANGLVGAVNGIGFSITSILSGLVIGFAGMGTALWLALGATVVAFVHMLFVSLPEPEIVHTEESGGHFDFKKTLAIVTAIPGLITLIFFTTFNNFLGGVFMALMDAYGLSLMSVQAWGFMFAVLSLGFILGSGYIAHYGLGANPLRAMLMVNVVTWTSAALFTIQPSIILLALGMLVWMSLIPFIEAAEHTVIQNVVPYERQGRVFGFAHSIESAATPITTFLIGPIAAFIFIPFMTTGAGVDLIGDWYGTGQDRGIALVFTLAGVIGLCVTLLAFKSKTYRMLSARVTTPPPADSVTTQP